MQTSLMPPQPAADFEHLDLSRIAQDLQIRKVQVESVVQLLDEGNTVPFITRYRKERTGGLDEEVIRIIQGRVGLLRQLAERKKTVLKSIEAQGKLTDELRQAIARRRDAQASRRSVPALQAQEAHPGHHRPRERSGTARSGRLERRSRGQQPRRNPADPGQSRKGVEHARGRAARRAAHPGRAHRRNGRRPRRHPLLSVGHTAR